MNKIEFTDKMEPSVSIIQKIGGLSSSAGRVKQRLNQYHAKSRRRHKTDQIFS